MAGRTLPASPETGAAKFQAETGSNRKGLIVSVYEPENLTADDLAKGFKSILPSLVDHSTHGGFTLTAGLTALVADLIYLGTAGLRVQHELEPIRSRQEGMESQIIDFNPAGIDVAIGKEGKETKHVSYYDQIRQEAAGWLGDDVKDGTISSLLSGAIRKGILMSWSYKDRDTVIPIAVEAIFPRKKGSKPPMDGGTLLKRGESFDQGKYVKAIAVAAKVLAPVIYPVDVNPKTHVEKRREGAQGAPNDNPKYYYLSGPIADALYHLHVSPNPDCDAGEAGVSRDEFGYLTGLKRTRGTNESADAATAKEMVAAITRQPKLAEGIASPADAVTRAITERLNEAGSVADPGFLVDVGLQAQAALAKIRQQFNAKTPLPYAVAKVWAELADMLSDSAKLGFKEDSEIVTFMGDDETLQEVRPPAKTKAA